MHDVSIHAIERDPLEIGRAYRLPTVDLYGPVHKGLRFALCDLLIRLGRTDADDLTAVQEAVDDLAGLLYLCEAHAEHENAFLHRALEARMAGGSAARAHEHQQQRIAIAALHELSMQLLSAAPDTRAERLRALSLRYADFVGENLVHMSREEEETQKALTARYTHAELEDLQHRLVSAIGAEEYVAFMRMMLVAASPPERTQLEAIVQATQPEAVQARLLRGRG